MSRSNEWKKFALGIFLLIIFHSLTIALTFTIHKLLSALFPQSIMVIGLSYVLFFYSIIFIGISQFIYGIPIIIILIRKHQYSVMKGVIMAAILTFLLNVAFWIWLDTWFSFS